MFLRTVSGAVITVLVYAVIYFSCIEWVMPACISLLSVFAVYELLKASNQKSELLFCLSSFVAFIAPFTGLLKCKFTITAAFVIAIPLFSFCMLYGQKINLKILPVLAIIIILLNSACAVNNKYLLYSSVTVCFATDIFAYLIGRFFGKRKLCKNVSPNKTVEGAFGGILFAVLFTAFIGFLLEKYFTFAINYKMLVLYTVLTSIVGQFGDLSMSAVKRMCKIKDFGNVIPGHGGVLDRFDSHIFAVAFTYVFSAFTCGFIV